MAAATADEMAAAFAYFGRILRTLDEAAWSRSTPCAEWDVRQLVNHVVATTTKFSQFAEGCTDAPRTPGYDMLGDSCIDAFDAAVDRSRRAWLTCDPGRICRLPFGQFTAFDIAAINLFDVLVHAWDLATAVNLTVVSPPQDLVTVANSVACRLVTPEAIGMGIYARPEGDTGSGPAWAAALRRTGRAP